MTGLLEFEVAQRKGRASRSRNTAAELLSSERSTVQPGGGQGTVDGCVHGQLHAARAAYQVWCRLQTGRGTVASSSSRAAELLLLHIAVAARTQKNRTAQVSLSSQA